MLQVPIIIEDNDGKLYCVMKELENTSIKSIWALDIPSLSSTEHQQQMQELKAVRMAKHSENVVVCDKQTSAGFF